MKIALKAFNIIEYLFYPWKDFFIKDLLKGRDYWVGETPTLALWIKFLWQTKIKLSNRARLVQLNYQSIVEIQEKTSYFRDQSINKHNKIDRDMLKKSLLSIFPHETYQIRIINEQNCEFNSLIYHGKISQSSSPEELKRLIKNLSFKARQKGLTITEIEVAHTHPSLELLILEKSDHRFIFNGLSKTDIKTGHYLSEFINYPLRISAITPAAIYSKLF